MMFPLDFSLVFTAYDGCKRQWERQIPYSGPSAVRVNSALWNVSGNWNMSEEIAKGEITFALEKGAFPSGSVGIRFDFSRWGRSIYVMMPAAVYNGNRYRAVPQEYPPYLREEQGAGPAISTTITDVPRLRPENGPSAIRLLAGDMATPAVCLYDPDGQEGWIFLFSHDTPFGYNGVTLEENDDKSRACLSIQMPGVRSVKYTMLHADTPSDDTAADFREGDTLALRMELHRFPCRSIDGLYRRFFQCRSHLSEDTSCNTQLPYSAAFSIFQEKFNRENWNPAGHYYRIGTNDHLFQDFQSGWPGGGINTYPLYLMGTALSKQRALQTLDFIFSTMQAESGFFYGIYYNGRLYGDRFDHPERSEVLLLRKNADMLYFLLRLYETLRQENLSASIQYEALLRKACDAFVRLWQKNGQLGQFIDLVREKILIGETAGPGIAPAALALAGRLFQSPLYLKTAAEAAERYDREFIQKGLTNGGPGEILQSPDSESAFGLLESFVVLYETTGERRFLEMAERCAVQCATWCVSYNFHFPPSSEFGKLGIKTVGSVYANVQNKHSAPGICLLSGSSLFRLFRATGDQAYLELIQKTAHNITQYVSRSDRPIHAPDGRSMPAGYVNERVNMCDWEGKDRVGGIFYGSCWSETSAMLTMLELPGVYAVPDRDLVVAFDNVLASLEKEADGSTVLLIQNPTQFDAVVTVFWESEKDWAGPLPFTTSVELPTISLPAGGQKRLTLGRRENR